MFKRLKEMFFGDKMTKKQREQISYYLQYEHKFEKPQADYLAESGEWKKLVETV